MSGLAPNVRVTLHSLKANPELNGQLGTLLKFNKKRQRWAVKVDGVEDPVMILAEKLTLVTEDAAASVAAEVPVVETAAATQTVAPDEPELPLVDPAKTVPVVDAAAAVEEDASTTASAAEPTTMKAPAETTKSAGTVAVVEKSPVVALAGANPAVAWLLKTFCCVEPAPSVASDAPTPKTVISMK